jgi:hypothetical protein
LRHFTNSHKPSALDKATMANTAGTKAFSELRKEPIIAITYTVKGKTAININPGFFNGILKGR